MNAEDTTIPGMNLDAKYSTKKPVVPENSVEVQKEMDKTKKELEKLKSVILKKYKYTLALSILPPQSVPLFVDEEEVPKETEKFIQLYMIIPEDKFKEIPKIKKELVGEVEKVSEKMKQKVWLQIKTPVDVFENCMDSKFDLTAAIAMSFPLYDSGFLSGIRAAEIHKSLVLQKFEKYVVSYVLGGSLVRGDFTKDSDVDVFVIINDTDVKRMPRLELKERLRNIIFQYIGEAEALAGVKKNTLNIQIYLLTDFWESVKDAHPVMFTFIRDGVPIHDRGTFLPWKALLRMGKLKPSPEAIDSFMAMGDKTVQRSKMALLDILVHDIYWGVVTPSQALLMLNGLPPPAPKHLIADMKKAFVTDEKMLEMKYIKILENVVQKYKDYEHQKLKEISGTEIDKLLKDSVDFLKRLKELRKQIEKRSQEKIIEEIHKEIFDLLKTIVGRKAQEKTIEDFDKLVKGGKFPKQSSKILKNVIEARKQFKKGKLNAHKVDSARKEAGILINDLIEYNQRCDLASMEKGRMRIKAKDKVVDLITADGKIFVLDKQSIKKVEGKSVSESNVEELNEAVEKQKSQEKLSISGDVFVTLKKELGDFEIVL